MSERKLATIRTIAEVQPIPGADFIEAVRVDGWWVVDKKGRKVGEKVVYFEIDSYIPVRPEFEFLRASSYKPYSDGREGFRLKTRKLRKQISQGLVMTPSEIGLGDLPTGTDVTEQLGVTKWEPMFRQRGAGSGGGGFNGRPFPSDIQKTDQERIQNVRLEDIRGGEYEVTLKLDGTSLTVFARTDGTVGVCSRNYELMLDRVAKTQSWGIRWRRAFRRFCARLGMDTSQWPKLIYRRERYPAEEESVYVRYFYEKNLGEAAGSLCHLMGRDVAIQGELMGPGIQKNREGLEELQLFVFDIYIPGLGYMVPEKRRRAVDLIGLTHIPVLETNLELDTEWDRDKILAYADRKSLNHKIAEGVVFKRNRPLNDLRAVNSFKAINNRFLLKEED
jgi:RNA ligase (TIGR02306 family)